jgi:hypothetical protein
MSVMVLTALLLSTPTIDGLQGGRFGAEVIDLDSGEILYSTGEGSYPLASSRFLLLAFAADVALGSGMPVSQLVMGGSASEGVLVGSLSDPVGTWRSSPLSRYSDDYGAWLDGKNIAMSPFYSGAVEVSTGTVLELLRLIHDGIDDDVLSATASDPDMGSGHAAEVAAGWKLYGWVDSGEGRKSFILVVRSPQGRNLGLILLSDELCCQEKADLAMMLLWQETGGL